MNYDSSISSSVSLSKILDEMVIGGTNREVIIEFLRSHEDSIGEIYANSSFAYELYDIPFQGGYFHDDFLLKHIVDLPEYELAYAALSILAYLKTNEEYLEDARFITKTCKKTINEVVGYSKYELYGHKMDFDVLKSDSSWNLSDYLNENDFIMREVKTLLNSSLLGRSILSYDCFSKLTPLVQYLLIRSLFSVTYGVQISLSRDRKIHFAYSLMKQLLCANNVDLFNHVFSAYDKNMNKYFWQEISSKIPNSILNMFNDNDSSFEEIIFEVNLLDTTSFDCLDLFLMTYLCSSTMRNEMKNNMELLEFLDLPFEVDKLNFV